MFCLSFYSSLSPPASQHQYPSIALGVEPLQSVCRMGTLTDITGNTSGTSKRRSTTPMASQALSGMASSENLGKKPPHFMSPTLSSTKQATSKPSKVSNRNSTPSASSSKPPSSGNWMSSAAKRVGFGRVGDGTPRSKKEGPSKQSKAVSFPDKVCQFLLISPFFVGGIGGRWRMQLDIVHYRARGSVAQLKLSSLISHISWARRMYCTTFAENILVVEQDTDRGPSLPHHPTAVSQILLPLAPAPPRSTRLLWTSHCRVLPSRR